MPRPLSFSFPLTRAETELLFKLLDLNADGTLSRDELDAAFRSAHLRIPPVSIDQRAVFFKQLDADGNGLVTLEEFRRFVNVRQAQLRAVFSDICAHAGADDAAQIAVLDHADPDVAPRTAFNARTLQRAADAVRVSVSQADVANMMRLLDSRSQDGIVTFDEWCEALLLVPSNNPAAVFESWRRNMWLESDSEMFAPARDLAITADEERRGLLGLLSAVAKSVMSAGIAGTTAKSCTAPLDIIRTQMMASRVGVTEAVRVIRQRGGLASFWTGNGVNCCKAFPETAVRLLAFNTLCRHLASDRDNVTVGERLAFGSIAGALSATSTYPVEVARVRMMTSDNSGGGLWRTLATQARGGRATLFAGLTTALAAFVPFASIELTVNSTLQETLTRRMAADGRAVPTVPLLLASATVATSTAMFFTFPLTNLRVYQQANGATFRAAATEIFRNGISGAYRGLGISLLKSAPSAAISCVIYNMLKG
jgi:hypothetical protein